MLTLNLWRLPPPPKERSAFVALFPSQTLERKRRRILDRYPFLYFSVDADPEPGRAPVLPEHFHLPSLEWVVRSATLLVPWYGGYPYDGNRFYQAISGHCRPGGRVSFILLRSDAKPAWDAFLDETRRPETDVLNVVTLENALAAGAA